MYIRGRTALLFVILSIVVTALVTTAVLSDGSWFREANVFSSLSESGGTADRDVEAEFDKLEETYELLQKNYLHEVDSAELIDGAIQGMVESLGDPYSEYMDPEAADHFHSSLESSFEGIGAEVTMQDGRVTIVAPIDGSPAEKAGLRPNDQVLRVDGESLEGLTLNESVAKIRGPKGTEVELEILRSGSSTPLKITVTRDEIPLETVSSDMLDHNIGKIRLSNFAEKTAEDFAESLKQLEGQNMQGLIIDLRGNPGGYLAAVEEISNLLVPEGRPILWIEDRDGNKKATKSSLDGKKPYPIVVLIDRGSASASEILAAALKEAGGYTLIGEPSFGKGTVQTTRDFEDNSNLKYTIAKWLTPDQNWIHEKGVQPDIKVTYPPYYEATPPSAEEEWKRDDNSEQVRGAQLILEGLGYDTGRTDGYFDAETERAVETFQRDHDLKRTGVIDKPTALKLQDQLVELIRNPENDVMLQRAVDELKKRL